MRLSEPGCALARRTSVRLSAVARWAAMLACVTVLWSLGHSEAEASCPDPDRPSVEEDELTKRLNYHALGAMLCINGTSHICKPGGRWEAGGTACPPPRQSRNTNPAQPNRSNNLGSAQPDSPRLGGQVLPGRLGNGNPTSQAVGRDGGSRESSAPRAAPPIGLGSNSTQPIDGVCQMLGTCRP